MTMKSNESTKHKFNLVFQSCSLFIEFSNPPIFERNQPIRNLLNQTLRNKKVDFMPQNNIQIKKLK